MRWASSPGTRSGGSAACASRPTPRSARTCATRSRRSGRTGSRRSGSTLPAAPSRGASRRRSAIRPTPRSSRRAWCGGSPSRAAEAGAEIVEGRRVTDRAELEAETVVVATDGYPSGLLGELEGLIVPTRGQVIATEPLPERLFEAPHYGRHGFDYWHQTEDGRIVAGGFRDVSLEQEFTADEELTDDGAAGALDVRERPRRPRAPRRLPLGRHLRARAGLPPRRRRGARRCGARGSQAGTPATATCSASRAAGSSPGPSSATATRCSTCSSPPGCSADASVRRD